MGWANQTDEALERQMSPLIEAPLRGFAVVAVARCNIVKGWKIVAPSGRSIMGFTTRREAEAIADFFNEEVKS